MLSLRAHAWISGALLAALIGIPIAGNIAEAAGVPAPSGAWRLPFQIFYLSLFLAFALSAVPVIVLSVLRAQKDNAAAAPLIRNQARIVWVLWALMLLGAAIALPAMIRDGFFAASPKS